MPQAVIGNVFYSTLPAALPSKVFQVYDSAVAVLCSRQAQASSSPLFLASSFVFAELATVFNCFPFCPQLDWLSFFQCLMLMPRVGTEVWSLLCIAKMKVTKQVWWSVKHPTLSKCSFILSGWLSWKLILLCSVGHLTHKYLVSVFILWHDVYVSLFLK